MNVYSTVIVPVTLLPETDAWMSLLGVYCSNSEGKSITGSFRYLMLPVPFMV